MGMVKKSEVPSPELERMHDYQRALASFSRVAAETLPLERLLHHVAAQVSHVTHIRRVKVMCYRPDHGDLLMVAGVGWKPGLVGHATFALDSASPPGRALQTAAPVVVEDLPNDPEFRLSDALREHGIVSAANVPVRIDGRVWGVLEADADEPRTFTDADVTFLGTMANILGVAIRRLEGEREALMAAARHAREQAFAAVVLGEFKHRVKNNLQTIISLLALQRRHASSDEVRERLEGVMDRVHAIALAQDQLSFEAGRVGASVAFGDYLRALCVNINPNHEMVAIQVAVEGDAMLPLDRAVPVGLIVNELVTNALKYAFDEAGGTIRVAFTMEPDTGEGVLTVEDDGRGMQKPREGGTGLRLVEALAGQIEGVVERDAVARGTRTRLRFPVVL